MIAGAAPQFETVLGIRFYNGDVGGAVEIMLQGGLLVVPAAPALKDIQTQPAYREALLKADLVIADSAYMVLIWNFLLAWRLGRPRIRRLSGLEYLRALLQQQVARQPGSTVWVMAGQKSAALNLAWLEQQGITVPAECVYAAPMYGKSDGEALQDPALLELLERLRPAHVVITVGGGTQERLGLYLQQQLRYKPGIHCIGAAIAFLSGDQAAIPVWADRFYLGWLLRVVHEPKRYGPRYWAAKNLLQLMLRYGAELPPLLRTGTGRFG